MRRVISLFLPRWPSDRLRRNSKDFPSRDKPLVTRAAYLRAWMRLPRALGFAVA
jgi:hypothetical protein